MNILLLYKFIHARRILLIKDINLIKQLIY